MRTAPSLLPDANLHRGGGGRRQNLRPQVNVSRQGAAGAPSAMFDGAELWASVLDLRPSARATPCLGKMPRTFGQELSR